MNIDGHQKYKAKQKSFIQDGDQGQPPGTNKTKQKQKPLGLELRQGRVYKAKTYNYIIPKTGMYNWSGEQGYSKDSSQLF